jgi:hypothetical protein
VIVIEIEIAIVIVVKRATTAASDWADKHKAQEQQQKGRTDRVRERGCSMYSGGKRHTKPKVTLARSTRARGVGEHNPRGARGGHAEDGGL